MASISPLDAFNALARESLDKGPWTLQQLLRLAFELAKYGFSEEDLEVTRDDIVAQFVSKLPPSALERLVGMLQTDVNGSVLYEAFGRNFLVAGLDWCALTPDQIDSLARGGMASIARPCDVAQAARLSMRDVLDAVARRNRASCPADADEWPFDADW